MTNKVFDNADSLLAGLKAVDVEKLAERFRTSPWCDEDHILMFDGKPIGSTFHKRHAIYILEAVRLAIRQPQPVAISQGHTVEGIDDIVEVAAHKIYDPDIIGCYEDSASIIRHAIEEAVEPYADWIGRVLYESYPAKDADDAYMLIIERELFNELHKFFDAEILPKLKEQDLKEDKS